MPWKMLGDPEEVSADARRAFQEAELLREKGDKEAALKSYEEAVGLDDGFIRAHYWILKPNPLCGGGLLQVIYRRKSGASLKPLNTGSHSTPAPPT